MRWPWRLRRAIEPRPMVSRVLELETAKERTLAGEILPLRVIFKPSRQRSL